MEFFCFLYDPIDVGNLLLFFFFPCSLQQCLIIILSYSTKDSLFKWFLTYKQQISFNNIPHYTLYSAGPLLTIRTQHKRWFLQHIGMFKYRNWSNKLQIFLMNEYNKCFKNNVSQKIFNCMGKRLISSSSAFSKSSLNIWKFTVHVLLKPRLENFEHYFASV